MSLMSLLGWDGIYIGYWLLGTWSHTSSVLSAFGVNFCIIPVFGADWQPVTEPDWHVWHEIRALGDNVVFGLRAPVHVGKYKMTAGRVRIELVQSSVWAAGANPPGCPCGQCPTHGGLSRFCPICSHHQVPLLCQIWIALLQRISTFGVPSFT